MYKLQIIKTERKPRKKWSRKKKILVTSGVILVLAGYGYYTAHRALTGPAVGTVINAVPADKGKKEVELEQFDGKLISFVHPVTYVEQVQKQAQQNNLENHTFVSSEMVSHVLVMTITTLPSKIPEDDASYKMRLQDKAKYHMKSTVVKNEKVVIFTTDDAQQMQQAAFWVHGDKLLTFVLSGATTDPKTTTAQFDDMVESVSWH